MSDVLFLILRRLRAPLITLILVYAISVGGLALIPGVDPDGNRHPMSIFHAFYVMSYTATTIGFGELPYPFTDAQRLWVTFTIYLSVVGWAYTLGSVVALGNDANFRLMLVRGHLPVARARRGRAVLHPVRLRAERRAPRARARPDGQPSRDPRSFGGAPGARDDPGLRDAAADAGRGRPPGRRARGLRHPQSALSRTHRAGGRGWHQPGDRHRRARAQSRDSDRRAREVRRGEGQPRVVRRRRRHQSLRDVRGEPRREPARAGGRAGRGLADRGARFGRVRRAHGRRADAGCSSVSGASDARSPRSSTPKGSSGARTTPRSRRISTRGCCTATTRRTSCTTRASRAPTCSWRARTRTQSTSGRRRSRAASSPTSSWSSGRTRCRTARSSTPRTPTSSSCSPISWSSSACRC